MLPDTRVDTHHLYVVAPDVFSLMMVRPNCSHVRSLIGALDLGPRMHPGKNITLTARNATSFSALIPAPITLTAVISDSREPIRPLNFLAAF